MRPGTLKTPDPKMTAEITRPVNPGRRAKRQAATASDAKMAASARPRPTRSEGAPEHAAHQAGRAGYQEEGPGSARAQPKIGGETFLEERVVDEIGETVEHVDEPQVPGIARAEHLAQIGADGLLLHPAGASSGGSA